MADEEYIFTALYSTLNQRIKLSKSFIKELNRLVPKEDNICLSRFKKNKTKDRDILNITKKKIISPLFNDITKKDTLDSETWNTCLFAFYDKETDRFECDSEKMLNIAIKLFPITKYEYNLYLNPPQNQNDYYKYKIWKELLILEKCRNIIFEPHSIPNLPMLYSWNMCDKNKVDNFVNKNILAAAEKRKDTDEYGQRLAILWSELADKNLHTWLLQQMKAQQEDIIAQIDNMLFAILVGLISLEINMDLVHFDLHVGNVLVVEGLEHKSGEYWKYTYKNHNYYIPNIGTMFYIWDFSLSGVKGESDAFFIRNMLKYGKRLINNDLFANKAETLAKNIINHGYQEYLYSYDVFRITQGIYRVIDQCADKFSSSDLDNPDNVQNKWNFEYSDKIEDILDLLYDIREASANDLTKRLLRNTSNKSSKIKIKHEGRPLDILQKYFKKYKKLPKNGKITKEFKIDLKI